ncbi:iron chelate uptake ABC transporter family permease subunit [Devosia sp. YIM 151766]|uniref:FecCD family ABC transporter permease n=1 Tax=Devosia sp. YIM 151766 TaxID=3017325 RepID=UPI00255CD119|nr:iron chelate uptake ABC transporter family permease subunit [Devosia sp. YIM 151766]WIY54055.1 iron chelate uptake ABC transporter family permease subunit [Devosia sp. YIM 151766]
MTLALDTGRIVATRARAASRRRTVSVGLLAALLVAFALALNLGDYPVPVDGVIRSLLSPFTGLTDRGVDFIVLQVRLPRAILAVLSGAAFAWAGIIFQTLLRNPLASPDIIGIAHGASAAAVFCIIILGWTGLAVSLGAFGGAVLTALAIYLLAWRNGVTAYRVVLIGIGMAAMLAAVISYLFTRARLNDVQQAMGWLVGSLNAARPGDILVLGLALAVLVPLMVTLLRSLDAMELGDDTARSLGARVEFTRLGLMLVAVGFAAFATSVVGPVGFVAFVSGPLARALLKGAGRGFPQAALVGSLVMLVSDLVAQHLLPATQLPVGVVTGACGALFLLWLLMASGRSGRVN